MELRKPEHDYHRRTGLMSGPQGGWVPGLLFVEMVQRSQAEVLVSWFSVFWRDLSHSQPRFSSVTGPSHLESVPFVEAKQYFLQRMHIGRRTRGKAVQEHRPSDAYWSVTWKLVQTKEGSSPSFYPASGDWKKASSEKFFQLEACTLLVKKCFLIPRRF